MGGLRSFFTMTEFDVVNRILTSILSLGNMRTSVVDNKAKFPFIYDLLKINNPKFFKFLLLDKSGMLLSDEEFRSRVEALIEFLYMGLVNFVLEKVNTRFKEQYYEQFGQDKKSTIFDNKELSEENESRPSRSKSPNVISKNPVRESGNDSADVSKTTRGLNGVGRVTKSFDPDAVKNYYDQMSPRTALVIIDSLGFVDLNRYGDYSEKNDNGFYEFTSNLFYESFMSFFNNYRYERPGQQMEEEGLGDKYHKINYLSNGKTLNNLHILRSLLVRSATDKEGAFDEIKKAFPAFDKNVLDKLNQRDENALDSNDHAQGTTSRKVTGRASPSPKRNQGKAPTGKGQSSLPQPTERSTQYVVVEHSFSEFLNYDLEDLYRQNNQPYLRKIRNMLWENKSLQNSFFESPERFPTRLQKQQEEQNEFFDSLQSSHIHFFYCLKIPRCRNEQERSQAVFLQFRGFDFESLVEYHVSNFPYKISYPFFVQKFNIMAKVAQVNPSLNVDYEILVRSILSHMFGEKHEDLFAFGHHDLFVKERFYLEADSLLKESGAKSRIVNFVEAALRDILSSHVDNNATVVKIAQNFLRQHFGAHPLGYLIKSVNKFKRLCRRYKVRKEITNFTHTLLDEILDKIEYYPHKKIVTIQAGMRGYLDRKVHHPQEAQAVARTIFQRKFEKIRNDLKTTTNALLLNSQILHSKQKLLTLAGVQQALMVGRHHKTIAPQALNTLLSFVKWGLTKIRLRKYLLLGQKKRKAAKVIKLFLAFVVQNNNIHYREESQKRSQILQEDKKGAEAFLSSLNRHLAEKGASSLPLKEVPQREEPIIKKKPALSSFVFSMERLDERWSAPDAFCRNMASTIAGAYKDELQRIELNDNETVVLTQKQRLIVFQNNSQRLVELKLPNKSDRYAMLNGFLLYAEETGVLKSKEIQFQAPNPGQGLNDVSFETNLQDQENIFGFTKFRDFCVRKEAVLGTTECRKICYKENITSIDAPMRVFQFKRLIAQIALGKDFMIVADESGVAYATGQNAHGQLGLGHVPSSTSLQIVKRLVESKEIVKSVSCGAQHVLAVTANNRVFGWGSNYWYQFGERLKNYKYALRVPRDLSQHFELDKDIKVQAACGKYSSYLLTANKKFIKVGRVSGGTLIEKPKVQSLGEFAPAGVFVVGLNVQWNSFLDIVLFRVFDTRNSDFEKSTAVIPFSSNLFEFFVRKSQVTMVPYTDNFGNVLPMSCMNSKLADVHNKKDSSRLNKMVENFLFVK